MIIKSYNNYKRPHDNVNVLTFSVEIPDIDVNKMINDDLYKEYIVKRYLRDSEDIFKSFMKELLEMKELGRYY